MFLISTCFLTNFTLVNVTGGYGSSFMDKLDLSVWNVDYQGFASHSNSRVVVPQKSQKFIFNELRTLQSMSCFWMITKEILNMKGCHLKPHFFMHTLSVFRYLHCTTLRSHFRVLQSNFRVTSE